MLLETMLSCSDGLFWSAYAHEERALRTTELSVTI